MKRSVPPIFVNGGYRLFLCNYYAFTILLHTNSKILHPGCNVSCKLLGISKLFLLFYIGNAFQYIQDVMDMQEKISKIHYMRLHEFYIGLH